MIYKGYEILKMENGTHLTVHAVNGEHIGKAHDRQCEAIRAIDDLEDDVVVSSTKCRLPLNI